VLEDVDPSEQNDIVRKMMMTAKSWHAMIDLKASSSILRLERYLSSETSLASLH
jgi:hypothetical protein